MLPYPPVAMDYGYQRQSAPSHPGTHMTPMGSLGMPAVSAGPFAHSWLVPHQDLCAVPYNKMTNQHQQGAAGIHHTQQHTSDPGLKKNLLEIIMYVYIITIGHVHISAALSPYKHLIVHKIIENDNKTFSNTCPGGSYSLKEQSKNDFRFIR
uniref:Uncharacterized protein n=1 Tax=Glossina pallidipes TaxID=7398 RepID=A0A1A9ZSI1_GLOPL